MILRAAWVVPVGSPPIPDGFVQIRGNRIAALGPAAQAPGPFDEDLGAAALLPGLVNPHTHLELTCYHGRLAPGPFWPWVAELVGLRRQPGAAALERDGLRRGVRECLRGGVTTVGDISRTGESWRELADLPLRAVCFAELLSLAAEPPRTPAEVSAAAGAVPTGGRLRPGVAPHAPYTVVPADAGQAARRARVAGWPWTLHLAETAEEVAFLGGARDALPPLLADLGRQAGVDPAPDSVSGYVRRYFADAGPGALVHLNYLTPLDVAWLAASPHTVIYCPRAHRFFGHPPHPLPELLRAGVRVALGTDSRASNESLALLAEASCVQACFPGLCGPADLIEMITRTAAGALGMSAEVGSLAPGMLADLAAFPLRGGGDPLAGLVRHAPEALAVWIDGQRVELSGP